MTPSWKRAIDKHYDTPGVLEADFEKSDDKGYAALFEDGWCCYLYNFEGLRYSCVLYDINGQWLMEYGGDFTVEDFENFEFTIRERQYIAHLKN